MPGMDGLTLGRAIVADPTLTAAVVLMSSLGHDPGTTEIARSGIGATLFKPVHRKDIRAAVRRALGLPMPVVARPAPAVPAPEAAAGRLLLAEDNLINQKIAVAMLSSAGYQVDTVLNGAAAVQAVAARAEIDGSYGAILMDCHMPELNGYEATAAIRAQEGTTRHTPIIAMTADAHGADRGRCLAAGMDSYLAKPVSKEALLYEVARSIRDQTAAPAEGPR
jgi:CheY-like chemotaxis protein